MATFSEVQKAIRAYPGGAGAANRIVQKVAGTTSLADCDSKHFGAIIRALEDSDELDEQHKQQTELRKRNGEDDDGEPVKVWTEADLEPTVIYDRWNSSRAPSQD